MNLNKLLGFVIAVALVLLLIGAFACSEDSEEPSQPSSAPNIAVTGYIGCKGTLGKLAGVGPMEECIEWQYDEDGLLHVHHVNAGFNCCVDALMAGFEKEGGSITITETEDLDNGGCHCLCLYDIDYEMSYLAAGEYVFTIIGPCMDSEATPEEDYITFSVDLGDEPTGSYCVSRDHYPWE